MSSKDRQSVIHRTGRGGASNAPLSHPTRPPQQAMGNPPERGNSATRGGAVARGAGAQRMPSTALCSRQQPGPSSSSSSSLSAPRLHSDAMDWNTVSGSVPARLTASAPRPPKQRVIGSLLMDFTVRQYSQAGQQLITYWNRGERGLSLYSRLRSDCDKAQFALHKWPVCAYPNYALGCLEKMSRDTIIDYLGLEQPPPLERALTGDACTSQELDRVYEISSRRFLPDTSAFTTRGIFTFPRGSPAELRKLQQLLPVHAYYRSAPSMPLGHQKSVLPPPKAPRVIPEFGEQRPPFFVTRKGVVGPSTTVPSTASTPPAPAFSALPIPPVDPNELPDEILESPFDDESVPAQSPVRQEQRVPLEDVESAGADSEAAEMVEEASEEDQKTTPVHKRPEASILDNAEESFESKSTAPVRHPSAAEKPSEDLNAVESVEDNVIHAVLQLPTEKKAGQVNKANEPKRGRKIVIADGTVMHRIKKIIGHKFIPKLTEKERGEVGPTKCEVALKVSWIGWSAEHDRYQSIESFNLLSQETIENYFEKHPSIELPDGFPSMLISSDNEEVGNDNLEDQAECSTKMPTTSHGYRTRSQKDARWSLDRLNVLFTISYGNAFGLEETDGRPAPQDDAPSVTKEFNIRTHAQATGDFYFVHDILHGWAIGTRRLREHTLRIVKDKEGFERLEETRPDASVPSAAAVPKSAMSLSTAGAKIADGATRRLTTSPAAVTSTAGKKSIDTNHVSAEGSSNGAATGEHLAASSLSIVNAAAEGDDPTANSCQSTSGARDCAGTVKPGGAAKEQQKVASIVLKPGPDGMYQSSLKEKQTPSAETNNDSTGGNEPPKKNDPHHRKANFAAQKRSHRSSDEREQPPQKKEAKETKGKLKQPPLPAASASPPAQLAASEVPGAPKTEALNSLAAFVATITPPSFSLPGPQNRSNPSPSVPSAPSVLEQLIQTGMSQQAMQIDEYRGTAASDINRTPSGTVEDVAATTPDASSRSVPPTDKRPTDKSTDLGDPSVPFDPNDSPASPSPIRDFPVMSPDWSPAHTGTGNRSPSPREDGQHSTAHSEEAMEGDRNIPNGGEEQGGPSSVPTAVPLGAAKDGGLKTSSAGRIAASKGPLSVDKSITGSQRAPPPPLVAPTTTPSVLIRATQSKPSGQTAQTNAAGPAARPSDRTHSPFTVEQQLLRSSHTPASIAAHSDTRSEHTGALPSPSGSSANGASRSTPQTGARPSARSEHRDNLDRIKGEVEDAEPRHANLVAEPRNRAQKRIQPKLEPADEPAAGVCTKLKRTLREADEAIRRNALRDNERPETSARVRAENAAAVAANGDDAFNDDGGDQLFHREDEQPEDMEMEEGEHPRPYDKKIMLVMHRHHREAMARIESLEATINAQGAQQARANGRIGNGDPYKDFLNAKGPAKCPFCVPSIMIYTDKRKHYQTDHYDEYYSRTYPRGGKVDPAMKNLQHALNQHIGEASDARKCLFCVARMGDRKSLVAHLSQNHPLEYDSFFIEYVKQRQLCEQRGIAQVVLNELHATLFSINDLQATLF